MRRGRKRHEKVTKKRNRDIQYMQKIHEFKYLTKDEALIKEFEDLVSKDWDVLLGYIRESGNILTVGDNDLRSLLNETGAYNNMIKLISQTFDMQASNRSKFRYAHEEHILTIIAHESKSLRSLITKLKKYIKELVKSDYRWNVVYYSDYEERGAKI